MFYLKKIRITANLESLNKIKDSTSAKTIFMFLDFLFLPFQIILAMQTDKWFFFVSPTSIVADSGLISTVCKIYLVSGLLIHRDFFFNLFSWKVMESMLLLLFSEKMIEVQRLLFCFK